MISLIKKILNSMKNIDGWKISEQKVESSELFFIKQELDMNRCKNVHLLQVTVYKNFEEDGNKFTGSSSTNIYPTMGEDEIKEKLEETAFAASFIKNPYYPLVKPTEESQATIESKFFDAPISNWLPSLTEAIFKLDNEDNGYVNSAELFLNKFENRIMNSQGVDLSFNNYKGYLEFITNWKEDGEEVELYKDLHFSDYQPEMISEEVKNMLNISKERSVGIPTPSLKNHSIILTGEHVKTFLDYYYTQSNVRSVYEQISTAKLNDNIQGVDVSGDLVTIKLDPLMKNSTMSAPYDSDGFPLKEVTIFEKGILRRYWGDQRYSSYMNMEPTGNIPNFVVEGGSVSAEEFKQEPYMELLAFSDFQMDPLTGDFAGEIRLGRYFDGEKIISVVGGSISGNIKDVQKEMYLSKELQQCNNFIGPKYIKLLNLNISGN